MIAARAPGTCARTDRRPPDIGHPANSALLEIDATALESVAAVSEAELLAAGPKAIRIPRTALAERGLPFRV